jgi:hypothetical protein
VEEAETASQPHLMVAPEVLEAVEMAKTTQQQAQEPQIKDTTAERVKPHPETEEAEAVEVLAL